jgi:hypothetical protein
MKSFRLKKTSGDEDVTYEALVWLVVLALVIVPLIVFVAGPYLRDFMAGLAG